MNVCLLHPFDPRGPKVGGLETYIRDFIRFHPDDINILMIGVDGKGDLPLGKVTDLEVQGRHIRFMPIIHYSDNQIHEAAKSILNSITFQFAAGLTRHLLEIRKLLKSGMYTVDLRRVEFAFFCVLTRTPFFQMLHGEGAPKLKMDSLLGRYRFIHNFNEQFAIKHCERFLCVNPMITERIKSLYPSYAGKISTLTTWYNPDIYAPTQFILNDNILRILFCGRLDAFKAPWLMFKVIKNLKTALGKDRIEFHYIGTSEPTRFTEFDDIQDVTHLHGFQPQKKIAEIAMSMHATILTSEFEGMPRCTLEGLGAGRPAVAVHLPQLEAVIEDGVSGYLVPRTSEDKMLEKLTERFLQIWKEIKLGHIDPQKVAHKVADFTPQILLEKVYSYHREVHQRLNA